MITNSILILVFAVFAAVYMVCMIPVFMWYNVTNSIKKLFRLRPYSKVKRKWGFAKNPTVKS